MSYCACNNYRLVVRVPNCIGGHDTLLLLDGSVPSQQLVRLSDGGRRRVAQRQHSCASSARGAPQYSTRYRQTTHVVAHLLACIRVHCRQTFDFCSATSWSQEPAKLPAVPPRSRETPTTHTPTRAHTRTHSRVQGDVTCLVMAASLSPSTAETTSAVPMAVATPPKWAVSAANAAALLRRWASEDGTPERVAPVRFDAPTDVEETGVVAHDVTPPMHGCHAPADTTAVAGVKRRRPEASAATSGTLPARKPSRAGATGVRPCKSACPHGRRRRQCKECGGSSICYHGRRRSQCKQCGGSSICKHGRQRSKCKECGGVGICEHGRIRHRCRDCGGAGICTHGRQRCRCKECGGGAICEHGRQRYRCKECGGGGICEHGCQRYRCKVCGGGSICAHGRERYSCKECGGSGICEHGRARYRCKVCGGVCVHCRVATHCRACRATAAASSVA